MTASIPPLLTAEAIISIPWTPGASLMMPSGFMGMQEVSQEMLEACLEIQDECFMRLGAYLRIPVIYF